MHIARTGFFFLLTLIIHKSLVAQDPETDSLRAVINNSNDIPQKISAYKELATKLAMKDFDAAIAFAKAGAELAEAHKDLNSFGEILSMYGLAHYFKGNYDSAAVYYYKALDVLAKANNDLKRAGVLNNIGRLYRKTRDLDRALQTYDEAYAIFKDRNDEEGMATILNESGVVFEYKGDYEEAINRYKSSMAIREKKNDLVGKGYSLNFIGGAYTLQKKFPEAEKYLLDALEIRRQLKDSFAIALNYADLGFMYMEQGKFDKAIEQYGLSNSIGEKIKYADLLMGNYRELATIAEKKGDPMQSLRYFKTYSALRDSIYTGEKMKQIEQLNVKYQTEKKEQQLKLQEAEISRKNYLLWSLVAGVTLLILAGSSFYRRRQLQNKMQLQEEVMKQQDMATRSIIVAEENERKRIAAELHDGVGQMMSAAKMNLSAFENDITFKDTAQRSAFERVISLVDESCREVRSVSHQMMPNALLKNGLASAVKEFLDKIDNRIIKINLHAEGLNEKLDTNTETVLYRVIQECVNNVIKHSGASELDISMIKDKDGIAATVEDNGRGFDIKDKSNMEGVGLKNIRSRVEFLKGSVDFDSSPGRGTLVAIHVPLAQ